MSAYRQMNTVMNDEMCLYKALTKRFKAVERHKVPTNLYGFQGDKRPDLANLIVRRQHVGGSSNDIGFLKNDSGNYTANISSYDSHKYNQQWMEKLAQDYMEEKATQTMTENECELEHRKVLPNGAIQLRYKVSA